MALVIEVAEGESVYVGNTKVKLEEVKTPMLYKVSVDGPMIKVFSIDDKTRQEILPNVFLSAGLSKHKDGRRCKWVIEAPQTVKILREKLYFEKHPRP